MKKFFRITASVLGFAYAGFLAMFAFDAPFGLRLFVHLIPNILVIFAALIGLRSAWGGFTCFAALVAAFTVFFHSTMWFSSFMIVTAPLILIALLYLLSAALRGKS